jgi:hypothetical protein
MLPLQTAITRIGRDYTGEAPKDPLTLSGIKDTDCMITLEPLDASKVLLYFNLTGSKYTLSMEAMLDEQVQKKLMCQHNFLVFGVYPKTTHVDLKMILGKLTIANNIQAWTNGSSKEIVFNAAHDEYLYFALKMICFGNGYDYGCNESVEKIKRILPWVGKFNYPNTNAFKTKNTFKSSEVATIEITAAYTITNPKAEGGRQVVYQFEERKEAVLDVQGYVNSSQEILFKKALIDRLDPLLGMMSMIHGEGKEQNSPLVKFCNYMITYAERTGNYKRARIITNIFLGTIEFMILALKTVAAVGAIGGVVFALVTSISYAEYIARREPGEARAAFSARMRKAAAIAESCR